MGWERWRRVPEPGACDFCLMLATRGAVYASQETAGKDNDYHAHCHCDQESEGNFDARTDVRISLSDARETVDFRHNGTGRDYSYDLSNFRNLGVSDVPGAPSWELGLAASADEVELRLMTIARHLDDTDRMGIFSAAQRRAKAARIARLNREADLLIGRDVLRPKRTPNTGRRKVGKPGRQSTGPRSTAALPADVTFERLASIDLQLSQLVARDTGTNDWVTSRIKALRKERAALVKRL